MVNHLRTLLLNVDGTNNPGKDFPGEEFVEEGFRALEIPVNLKSVYNCLFPENADRAYKNLRLKQYMTVLHASELNPYVFKYDKRITYLPCKKDLFNALLPVVTTKQLSGTSKNIYIYGKDQTLETEGKIYFQWNVKITSSTKLIITGFDESRKTTIEQEKSYTTSDGISSLIYFPNSPVSFRFEEGLESVWTISALGKPRQTLVDVINDLESKLSSENMESLFGIDSDLNEPYKTCRNIWNNYIRSPIRISSVVLALANRLHEIKYK